MSPTHTMLAYVQSVMLRTMHCKTGSLPARRFYRRLQRIEAYLQRRLARG